jgi:hypothetical protein
MAHLGIQAGPLCTSYLAAKDDTRKRKAAAKAEVVAKKRRLTKRLREVRVEQHSRGG